MDYLIYMLKYSILVLEQDVYIENKEEIIDEKGGNNLFFSCFCNFVANSRIKCFFQKIKSRQKHCQNNVKYRLMDVKTTARLTFWS